MSHPTGSKQDLKESEEFVKQFHEYKENTSITIADEFDSENDDGDTEYKLKLVNPSSDRLIHLVT